MKLRAFDHRRQLPRRGQPRRDVMHIANCIDCNVEVYRIDGFEDDEGIWPGEGDLGPGGLGGGADVRAVRGIVSALALWLSNLEDADQELLGGRLAGLTLQELASCTECSISNVFQRLKELGGDLARHADITVRKKPRKPRVQAPSSQVRAQWANALGQPQALTTMRSEQC